MKALKIFLVCAVFFLLERVLFARIEIFSLAPWLGFAFCLIGAAVSADMHTAIITAAVYGLVSDLAGGGATGSAMISFVLSAGLVHLLAGRIFRNSLAVSLSAVFVVGIFGEMLYYILNSRGLENFSFVGMLWSVALPLSAINTAVAFVLYPLSKRIFAGRRIV